MESSNIRKQFLEFFKSKNHMVEPGASLVPHNDPTLLWINSGVAALKKYFDGTQTPKNPRIVNVQKSIRTNDIDNVGKTARHHTFFEMLGNFSIGDYFKKEAIEYAWEFLTSPKWMGFNPDKMYVSVYPTDQEAYDIWVNDIGIDPKRILKSEDNFWQIGDGPCGPNTEIYVDRGEAYDPTHQGEKLFFEEIDNDRYVEVWNVVFSQFNGVEGQPRSTYKELPQKNIDTGMGFERLCMLSQDVPTNYDTDLFAPIIKAIASKTTKKYADETMAFRVIADHIRTVVFALSDGALFSNEGRGYVLRRLLRRAVRYGIKLDIKELFLKDLVAVVIEAMGDFYPEIQSNQALIENLIEAEEKRFKSTLSDGETLLLNTIKNLKGDTLDGVSAFTLYDTYGFPLELTQEISQEHGVKVDVDGFKQHMKAQQERARNAQAHTESMQQQSEALLSFNEPSSFVGYSEHTITAQVIALFANQVRVDTLEGEGYVVFDQTPFYAESGGQVADGGIIQFNNETIKVQDVIKAPHKQHLHRVRTNTPLSVNDIVTLSIDQTKREKIKANHTLAHLLQAALKNTLGDHVHQAGSFVSDEYMRFDFTHFQKVETQQLQVIEDWMNQQIFDQIPLTIKTMDLEEAKQAGATALFDEKYDSKVRVVSIGDVSMELCGGTHVSNTSEIAIAKVVSEESIGSGVRRILCKSKMGAYQEYQHAITQLRSIADTLSVLSIAAIEDKVDQLFENYQKQSHLVAKLQDKITQQQAMALSVGAKQINGISVVIKKIENQESKNLKSMVEAGLKNMDQGLIFLGAVDHDKVLFVCGCTKDLLKKQVDCSALVKLAAQLTGGNGGGRKDLAQAGGKDLDKVDEAMATITNKISEML